MSVATTVTMSDNSVTTATTDAQPNTTIRVSNLSEETTEWDLRDLFGEIGKIRRVTVVKDKVKRKPLGFAFVVFAEWSDAELAMETMQRCRCDYMVLRLEWAKPKKPTKGRERRKPKRI